MAIRVFFGPRHGELVETVPDGYRECRPIIGSESRIIAVPLATTDAQIFTALEQTLCEVEVPNE